jgi:aryl-alcohol dehydrogenase-like predicted oxidoreductase
LTQKVKGKVRKIALGTVQFGLDYGITGALKVPSEEIRRILTFAKENQIDTLDTAIDYGDSEIILGESGISGWKTVTKLPATPKVCQNLKEWVFKNVYKSLGRLRIPKLYGVLLHKPQELLGASGQQLYAALQNCKDQGLVQKIGISIYDPSELDSILNRYSIDLIQAPFNVIDRRLETSGWLERLHQSGVEIHVRSVFLQGLLLMPKNQRPEKFDRWNKLWDVWHTWLEENQVSALQACLNFVLKYLQIDQVVVGVDSLIHFEEIVGIIDKKCAIPPICLINTDIDLVTPSNWRLL